jgi:hypothetical protein
MKKSFKTVDVLGLWTGVVLSDEGFGPIHEIMDHFYPGIMTIGCAVMANDASKEVEKQLPELKKQDPLGKQHWREWLKDTLPKLPKTLELDGPVTVDRKRISENFNNFGKDRENEDRSSARGAAQVHSGRRGSDGGGRKDLPEGKRGTGQGG